VKEFIEYIAKQLVDIPDSVRVEAEESEGRVHLRLYVDNKELGKIIGKAGKNAKAMRILLTSVGAKNKVRATLEIPDKVPESN
jgi:uncharacterized protein